MWKLDLLEAKFQRADPRFPHTKKLLSARNNAKLLRKLPVSSEEAEKEISALKEEYFHKKYYGAFRKLSKEIKKQIKSDINKWQNTESKKPIVEFFEDEAKFDHLITSKLVKCITNSVLVSKALKTNPPGYIPSDICTIISDKSNKANPSSFFINYCQNNKELNNYISNLWNSKPVKLLLSEIEWAFKVVRGNLTKQERESRNKLIGKDSVTEFDGDSSDSDSENEKSDVQDDDIASHSIANDNNGEIDAEEAFEKFAVYDNLVGNSDEDDEQFDLKSGTNYNEVTDEEPSDEELNSSSGENDSEDSFFEDNEKPKKKDVSKKYNLPELATGYFSGGSDDENDLVDEDKVVKEATTQRKNRRGQRARQKIWAQKYGREATHVKKEQVIIASEREQKRLEYEERCRKRELKAMESRAPTGSNTVPLAERKPREHGSIENVTVIPQAVEKVHPSWEAKRLAEEKQKNVKFEGKKIKFD